MIEINKGIVFSNDIKRIFSGVNAFDYSYAYIPSSSDIESVRSDFRKDVSRIFSDITIISEDDMMGVNNLIGSEYPHCYIG